MLLLATLAILVFGLALARVFALVLRVPRAWLMPVVFVLCVIGPYALTQRLFDVWVMVGFGLAGFVLRQLNFPMPPLVLGIILGDLLDKNLRRGLTLTDGELLPFFTRPISAAFVALIVLTILAGLPPVRRLAARLTSGGRP
jgi:putative tricarboxylic transport membrane protein